MRKTSTNISVRLDEQALSALEALEANGPSRSEAIGTALVELAARRDSLRMEAKAIAADRDDRAELRRVRSLMDELGQPG